VLVGAVGEADAAEHREAARAGRGAVDAEHRRRRHRHVVEDGAVREQVERLEDHAEAPAERVDRGVGGGQLVVAEEDAPGGGALQQVQAPQEGGLARAGRPDDADHLAGGDVEVDAAQDRGLPEALGDGLRPDGAHGETIPPRLVRR
jgi:hypothetical protein